MLIVDEENRHHSPTTIDEKDDSPQPQNQIIFKIHVMTMFDGATRIKNGDEDVAE
jgi:hypothetical protein